MQRSQGRDGLSRFRMGRRVGIYNDLLLLHRRRTCVCARVREPHARGGVCMHERVCDGRRTLGRSLGRRLRGLLRALAAGRHRCAGLGTPTRHRADAMVDNRLQ